MYKVKFYKGDYFDRQDQANKDKCVAYVEHHFNSSSNPGAGYSVVITGSNASQTSKNWGRWYAAAVAREFDISIGGDQGIVAGGYGGRGDYNLRFTDMPAILLEPMFASNPQHAQWICSESGQTRLATILCESIQRFFQEDGLIGLSVGHKYKTSNPGDRGTQVSGGGSEADYAEAVLEKTKTLLEAVEGQQEEREIKVVRDNAILWKQSLDADEDVFWDPVRGVLKIGS
jgi:hypothetical protein